MGPAFMTLRPRSGGRNSATVPPMMSKTHRVGGSGKSPGKQQESLLILVFPSLLLGLQGNFVLVISLAILLKLDIVDK